MTTTSNEPGLSAFVAGASTSLDASVFVGGSLLTDRHDQLVRAHERGVRIRFLFAHPAAGWIDDLLRPARIDPRAYARRMHITASRALMIGTAVEVRWQPFPIPWWFVVSDGAQVYLKAINLAGRPPATLIDDADGVGYFGGLFESAWERATLAVPFDSIASSPALRVFLCHASDDKTAVRELYGRLVADGAMPWLDEKDLLPGQDWELEISRAIRNSDVALICLSQRAVAKRGFVQREIRSALRAAEEMPRGTIFLVPVRLEPCEIPSDLRHLQWVDLFDPGGYALLSRALRVSNARPDAESAFDSV